MKREKQIEAMLINLGVGNPKVKRTKNNHFCVRLLISGERKTFFFAGTPSDRRSDKNKISLIKRELLKNNGRA